MGERERESAGYAVQYSCARTESNSRTEPRRGGGIGERSQHFREKERRERGERKESLRERGPREKEEERKRKERALLPLMPM